MNSQPDPPPDPLSELASVAVQLHEVYLTYTRAGFTDNQALYLVGKMVTASMGGQQ